MSSLRGASVFWLISLVIFAGLAVAAFVAGQLLSGIMLVLVLIANGVVGMTQPLERSHKAASRDSGQGKAA